MNRLPRVDPDLASAILLAAVLLVLALSIPDAPGTAYVTFAGAGVAAWLLLSAAALRHPGRAAELRGLLTTAGTVAAAGFLLRLGPDPMVAIREWILFVAGVFGFFAAAEIGLRAAWRRSAWFVAGVPAVCAAVALVPARGPSGTRTAAVLAWSAPLPVLALALAVLVAIAAIRLPWLRASPTTQAWILAVPALAVYAYTRDPAALVVVGAPLLAVLTAAQLIVWRDGTAWRDPATWRTLAVIVPSAAGAVVLTAGMLLVLQPGSGFALPGSTTRRDVLGVALTGAEPAGTDAVSARTAEAAGPAGVAVLMLLTVLLVAQVLLLARAAYGRARREGRDDLLLIGAAVTAHLVVTSAGPLAAYLGLPVPAGLSVLPPAADGAGFLLTFTAAGFLFGAGGSTAEPGPPESNRAGAGRTAAVVPQQEADRRG